MGAPALQAFRRTVVVAWPTHAVRRGRAHLAAVARAGHAAIMAEQTARGGVAPTFEAYANRPGQADLDAVALPGPIVYRYDYRREIALLALATLRRLSPVQSGEYRGSHTVYVNGVPAFEVPAAFAAGDEIVIANPVPYARKIEVGKTKTGRAFVVNAEPLIYERTASTLARRYRNVARITSGFVTPPDAYRLKTSTRTRRFTARGVVVEGRVRADRAAGAAVRAPALFIAPLPAGAG